jgi:hypothetical protein
MVDYSLVVDVAMDGLPTRLNHALFAAMSGTTWVRQLFGERGSSLHNMAYGKQLNGAENETPGSSVTVSSVMGPKINARQQRHVGALGNTLG